jgi:hypothetical protein
MRTGVVKNEMRRESGEEGWKEEEDDYLGLGRCPSKILWARTAAGRAQDRALRHTANNCTLG